MRTLVLLCLLSLTLCSWNPPDYSQCSSSWGSDTLGNGPSTICQAGCLMSSMSAAVAALGIKVDGQVSNPATFNDWLDKNGGYADGDLYVWAAADKLGLSFVGFDSTGAQAAASFNAGKIVVINVRGGAHWVLVTGVGNNEFNVMDPGFNTPTYSFSSVVKAGVYTKPAGSSSNSNSNSSSPASSGTSGSKTNPSNSGSSSSSSSPSKASGPMYGVDISIFSGAVSQSTMQCLVNQGKKFIIIEGWNGGHQVNSDLAGNVKNAWAAGFEAVDVYAFFCNECSGNTPASSAISTLSSYLKQNNVKYGTLWLDVEPSSGAWEGSSDNLNYIVQLAQAAQKEGINVGVYSSIGSWGDVVGSDSSQYLAGLPLWYAHYNNNPQMTDTEDYQFGGWKKAVMKQYQEDSNLCGLDTDLDYAPNGMNSTNQSKGQPQSEGQGQSESNEEQNPQQEEEITSEEEYAPEEEEEYTPEEEEESTSGEEEESTLEGEEEFASEEEEESTSDEEEEFTPEEEEESISDEEEEFTSDEEEESTSEEEFTPEEEFISENESNLEEDFIPVEEEESDEEQSMNSESENWEEDSAENDDDIDYGKFLQKFVSRIYFN